MMKKREPEPAWQTGLFVFFSVVTVILALPAAMDGDWWLAGGIFLGLLVLESAILFLARSVRRRRRAHHPGN